jgi:hypothetical protein
MPARVQARRSVHQLMRLTVATRMPIASNADAVRCSRIGRGRLGVLALADGVVDRPRLLA